MRIFFRPLKLKKKEEFLFSKKTQVFFLEHSRRNFGSFFVILWMGNFTPPNTTIFCPNHNFRLLYIILQFRPLDPLSILTNLAEKHGILNCSLSQNHA